MISVDTKKKELVGDCQGRPAASGSRRATPEPVRVHDFPGDAVGKAIPYGVYDMARNEAWVSVGRDHDTPAFAVASIRQWWTMMGRRAYPHATALFITADAGGSNGVSLAGMEEWRQALGRRLRPSIDGSKCLRCQGRQRCQGSQGRLTSRSDGRCRAAISSSTACSSSDHWLPSACSA